MVLPRLPVLIQQLREDASDADLLDRYVRHRADDAFTLLVSRYGRLVWGQCRNLLANEADAEDAFQATFLTLSRSAKSIRADAPLGPWLHGVAFRVCQNARRSAARRARHESTGSRTEANRPVPDSAWEVAFATVSEEVQKLPEAQRAVFVLCGLEGRSESEAADALGQKVGTVSSRLARAKQALLDRLDKRGFGGGAAVLGGLTASTGSAPAAVAARALAVLLPGGAVPDSIRSLTRGVVTMTSVRFKLLAAGALLTAALTFGVASGLLGNVRAQKTPEPVPLPARGAAPRNEVSQFKVDHPVECFAISRDGKTVAVGGPEKQAPPRDIYQPGRCTLIDAASGKVVQVIKTELSPRSLGFSPDGKRILIGELNRSKLVLADKLGSVPTRVWEVESGKPVLELDGHMDMVRGATYFPDGKRMVTSSGDGTARVWSGETGKELLLVRTGAFNDGVELSPDGKRVLVGSGLTKLTVWNAESGKGEFAIDTGYSANNAVFSPDGNMIAVCSSGVNDITLWDGKTGDKKGRIAVAFDAEKKAPIAGNVTSNLAFSPDGRWLATGNGHLSDPDAAGEVTIWDVENRKKAGGLKGHAALVNCVGFTPDGKSIVSCSADGTVIVRDFKAVEKELATVGTSAKGKPPVGAYNELRAAAGEVLIIEVTESQTTLPPVGSPTTVTVDAVVKYAEKTATKLKAGDAIKVVYGIPGAGAVGPTPAVMLKKGDVRVAYLNYSERTKAYAIAAHGMSFSGVVEKVEKPNGDPFAVPPADDIAPGGNMLPHNQREKDVLHEVVDHGKSTARSIADRLAKKGIKYTVGEVQSALDAWVSRGWCAVTDGQTHITYDAIAYMR